MKWSLMDSGFYNQVYLSEDGRSVLKVPILGEERPFQDDPQTDLPERAVRLWNMINKNIKPAAYELKEENLHGWVSPFIEGDPASDKEIANALMDICFQTGRVIVDAATPGNFLTKINGTVVCVDIGLALQLEVNEEKAVRASRRGSDVSLDAWEKLNRHHAFESLWEAQQASYPKTIQTIKALLFIKQNHLVFDEKSLNILKNNESLVDQLAQAYHQPNNKQAAINAFEEARETKIEIETPTAAEAGRSRAVSPRLLHKLLQRVEEACCQELDQYLLSRQPSKSGFNLIDFLRNKSLTNYKVTQAQDIKEKIGSADSLGEIKNILQEALQDKKLVEAGIFTSSGMKKCLETCMDIVGNAEKELRQDDEAGSSLSFK